METAIVYRHGPLSIGEHKGKVADLWQGYDAIRPEGHAGRMDTLYASPTLAGMVRWTHTSLYNQQRTGFTSLARHEITVRNPEKIYVYNIEVYERTSMGMHCHGDLGDPNYEDFNREIMEPYWATAIKLTEWKQIATAKDLHPMNWEVLLPADAIISHREICDDELMQAAPDYLVEELTYLLNASKVYGTIGALGE